MGKLLKPEQYQPQHKHRLPPPRAAGLHTHARTPTHKNHEPQPTILDPTRQTNKHQRKTTTKKTKKTQNENKILEAITLSLNNCNHLHS